MSEKVQEGDKVSWDYGSSHPSGTASEVKPGEVTVVSHRGNEISKSGTEENPAVHISRSGNDVVKTADELTIDKKGEASSSANGASSAEKKDEEKPAEEKKDEEKKAEEKKSEEPHAGDKRKADEKADAPTVEENGTTEKEPEKEKEVEPKKQKTANGKAAPAPKAAEEKTNGNGEVKEKKRPGRPKKNLSANGETTTKAKKEKKEPVVGRAQRQTRSQTKTE